jgi:hypothetical protein
MQEDIDESFAIRIAKRYMADHELEKPGRRSWKAKDKKWPSSVRAAGWALPFDSPSAYPVTVFICPSWRHDGSRIPEYQLPQDPEQEIEHPSGGGIRCNQELGKDYRGQPPRQGGFGAVVLTSGLAKPQTGIAGTAGVYGTQFLSVATDAQYKGQARRRGRRRRRGHRCGPNRPTPGSR